MVAGVWAPRADGAAAIGSEGQYERFTAIAWRKLSVAYRRLPRSGARTNRVRYELQRACRTKRDHRHHGASSGFASPNRYKRIACGDGWRVYRTMRDPAGAQRAGGSGNCRTRVVASWQLDVTTTMRFRVAAEPQRPSQRRPPACAPSNVLSWDDQRP